jgi:hypothetical protein
MISHSVLTCGLVTFFNLDLSAIFFQGYGESAKSCAQPYEKTLGICHNCCSNLVASVYLLFNARWWVGGHDWRQPHHCLGYRMSATSHTINAA